jgi:hypothetical protein
LALQRQDMLAASRTFSRPKAGRRFELTPELARRLVSDAVQAPSGGNCQPWKWLSDADELNLFHDRERAYAPFDPDCLGGLVALGAATENLILSAHASGLQVVSYLFPSQDRPEFVARFRFTRDLDAFAERSWHDELHSMVGVRHTNRRICARRPLKPGDLDALGTAVRSISDAEVYWLLRDEQLEECGRLLGRGDRLLFLTGSLNRFLVNEIRWTQKEAEERRDGISLESLELSPTDRAGFQLCRDWATLDLVRRMGGGRGLEKVSCQALAGASAVGLITMTRKDAAAYFWGGRAVERMWLTATQRQIALHPMTTLAYMFSQLRYGGLSDLDVEARETLIELYPRYQRLFPVSDGRSEVFLFRLSYAEETSQRSLRRCLDDVLEVV